MAAGGVPAAHMLSGGGEESAVGRCKKKRGLTYCESTLGVNVKAFLPCVIALSEGFSKGEEGCHEGLKKLCHLLSIEGAEGAIHGEDKGAVFGINGEGCTLCL